MGSHLDKVLQQGMSVFSPLLAADRETIDRFSARIKDLYARMNSVYAEASSRHGFSCSGCDENCCEERFYHYTFSEFLYLSRGVQTCGEETRKRIFERARNVTQLYDLHDSQGQAQRVMCPLNEGGLCCLYEYRLMICRLHGVPYKMTRPDGSEVRGGGCHRVAWDLSSDTSAGNILDRTGLYRELSQIEIGLRQAVGFQPRIKKTIAEMITDIEELLIVSG